MELAVSVMLASIELTVVVNVSHVPTPLVTVNNVLPMMIWDLM